MQASHDEAYAKCSDSKVGLRFEPQMVLQDDSGPVCYRLAVIVFRTGGMTDGHFYIAAPTTAGNWRVMNNSAAQQPVSLKQLQRTEGRHAHGVMYVRAKAPAKDDWASLNTTGSMQTPLHDDRYAAVCYYITAPRQGLKKWSACEVCESM